MSISEVAIKIIGVILAVVGLGVILSALGISVPVIPSAKVAGNEVVAVIIGIALIGFGIYVVRGGTPKV